MSGDSVGGCAVRHPQSGWEGRRGNSVGVGGVSVVIGKVEVRWDVGGCLSSKAE
jgi:hypothetical protein